MLRVAPTHVPAKADSPAEVAKRLEDFLTIEQKLFCAQYCDSNDVIAAYSLAYDCSAYTPDAVRKRAYALLNRWYIREYCAAIVGCEAIDDVLCTRAEVLDNLRSMLRSGKSQDRIKAAEILLAHLAPATQKIEHTHRLGAPEAAKTSVRTAVDRLRAEVIGLPLTNYTVEDK